jgi:hypothetical protein
VAWCGVAFFGVAVVASAFATVFAGGVYETQARVIAEAAAAIPQVQARWEALHLTAFKLAANRVREINAWGDDARKGPREGEGEGGAEAARGVRRAASGGREAFGARRAARFGEARVERRGEERVGGSENARLRSAVTYRSYSPH